jgi:hypothetical protein
MYHRSFFVVSETADRICAGKLIDFVGSGYGSSLQIVSLGWLASIAGVTGTEVALEEPHPIPPHLRPDHGLKGAKGIVLSIKNRLSAYWSCFGS